jgi:hypothetical protein
MSTISILGYSERGIFNSIVFYLGEHGELICRFIKTLGIDDDFFKDDCITYTFLIEQSFSKFGCSDLVIIAKNKADEKRVVFVEGKVKTSQGGFSLETNFDKLKKKEKFDRMSSNIFVQLYYKYLLTRVLEKDAADTSVLNIDDVFKKGKNKDPRKIGKNEIVLKAVEMIKDAQRYYFVAILPFDIKSDDFQKKYTELSLQEKMPIENVRSIYWRNIEQMFINDNDNIVTENFRYNKGQIYWDNNN